MLSASSMDERAILAIGRIERALARIEAASARPSAPSQIADDGEMLRLREAHHALRGKVEGAIGQIDRLLAGAEQG